jgi:hypothetical protein
VSSFFDDNRKDINKCIEKISKKEELVFIGKFLEDILERSQLFADNCEYNIEHIGRIFINSITGDIEKSNTIDDMLIFLIRIAKEFEINSEISLVQSGKYILNKYKEPSTDYSEDLNMQIDYAFNSMPYKILNKKNKIAIQNVYANIDNQVKENLEKKLPAINEKVIELKTFINNSEKVLNENKQKFNFVLLNQAFNHLSKRKSFSKYLIFFNLGLLGILMIALPIGYSMNQIIIMEHTAQAMSMVLKENQVAIYVLSLIPFLISESFIIYLFRILLHKYNSVDDQIVQLETKQAVVQFIESYVDFKASKNIKEASLEKFEEIVFSRISPNLQDVPNIPNVMDLVDGLGKVLKK